MARMNKANQNSAIESMIDPAHRWWQGAVIYQIYPRSLLDSNGDGVGDLPGITTKLDYIASLGVDAIWISPFFQSPMRDFGYDVSDFRAVDPLFGELADFDALIEKAHSLDLRVMIDLVMSHTSDQHRWFKDSERRQGNRDDWYVWVDANSDGSVPNNWLSVFGGSAWEWHEGRQQYFLHNFLASQPDLNFHCRAVQDQMLAELEFWLQRGVDGFRLDAVNYCFHDPMLRDNPSKPESERRPRGFTADNPYGWQYHRYDITQPENLQYLERVRQLLERYPDSVALGEINSDDSNATIAEYTNGHRRLHIGYSFELLADDCSPEYIRQTVDDLERRLVEGWPCWAISNHDVVRVATRWAKVGNPTALAKLFTAMVCSLRGTICTYQGEELGLPEAEIAREQVQDPYGINFWPTFKGRDGCRTPFPWTSGEASAGFSMVQPWLPIPAAHREKAVVVQDNDPDSVLNHYRQFLRWRHNQPALRWGNIEFIDTPQAVLGFIREHERQRLLVLFNFSEQSRRFSLPKRWQVRDCSIGGPRATDFERDEVILSSHQAWFGELAIESTIESMGAANRTRSMAE